MSFKPSPLVLKAHGLFLVYLTFSPSNNPLFVHLGQSNGNMIYIHICPLLTGSSLTLFLWVSGSQLGRVRVIMEGPHIHCNIYYQSSSFSKEVFLTT